VGCTAYLKQRKSGGAVVGRARGPSEEASRYIAGKRRGKLCSNRPKDRSLVEETLARQEARKPDGVNHEGKRDLSSQEGIVPQRTFPGGQRRQESNGTQRERDTTTTERRKKKGQKDSCSAIGTGNSSDISLPVRRRTSSKNQKNQVDE